MTKAIFIGCSHRGLHGSRFVERFDLVTARYPPGTEPVTESETEQLPSVTAQSPLTVEPSRTNRFRQCALKKKIAGFFDSSRTHVKKAANLVWNKASRTVQTLCIRSNGYEAIKTNVNREGLEYGDGEIVGAFMPATKTVLVRSNTPPKETDENAEGLKFLDKKAPISGTRSFQVRNDTPPFSNSANTEAHTRPDPELPLRIPDRNVWGGLNASYWYDSIRDLGDEVEELWDYPFASISTGRASRRESQAPWQFSIRVERHIRRKPRQMMRKRSDLIDKKFWFS